jgi:hypothetical protein
VLPGTPTRYEERLREPARERGVADRVHTPAWLSEPISRASTACPASVTAASSSARLARRAESRSRRSTGTWSGEAAEFSWDKAAERTLAVYRTAKRR